MFRRPHHQRILQVLQAFDAEQMYDADCFFAGGTAIVLQLGEYRESLDVDFLCASRDGYRKLRDAVNDQNLGSLLAASLTYIRDVRIDRYGIRTVLAVDGIPIKCELVAEGRIEISGTLDPVLRVPLLSREDLYAEKLLANTDRGLDRATQHRDLIDLAMMVGHWGTIPLSSWAKARSAYGKSVDHRLRATQTLLQNREYLRGCLHNLNMDEIWLDRLPEFLAMI